MKVLAFATGAHNVPLDGFDPAFTITMSMLPESALPTAHTCFNQLVLPAYRRLQTLREKLLYAVANTGTFELT